ncbi:MAG TPA: hypothetical protein VNI83_16075 [Vicinamibacterales bacterium]|nr:hypothetical protein [Vicinamibacterales bacterium]
MSVRPPLAVVVRFLAALAFAAIVLAPPASAVAPPVVTPAAPAIARQAPLPAGACAKTWVGRAQEIEEYLRTAKIVGVEEIPVGVTRPRRARLEAGGLVEAIAWKPIPPGMYQGFWESYKSEIGAYEIDKLLGLDMVPPTVEKRYRGDDGAAVMWASPTKSFKELGGVPRPPAAQAFRWNLQLIRAKLFDNLIGNRDPNLGNWLVDPDWHLILIDHSRALTTSKDLVHKMDYIDAELWEKMKALDEAALAAAVGRWVPKREIRAILERRDRLAREIDEMVAARGNAVFVREVK